MSSTLHTIVQIVPHRTSEPDGIGDYAVRLAGLLKERHGIDSVFLCGTPVGNEPNLDDGWPTIRVDTRTASALTKALVLAKPIGPLAGILLHVGGYGYSKRGAPLWLLKGVLQWRQGAGAARLIGVFHELYAKGRIWNSSFWLESLQKHVAKELWRLADAGVTTNSTYHRELCAWRPEAAGRLALMPVPSNVGEPTEIPRLGNRNSRVVVFGRSGMEAPLYGQHRDVLAATLERNAIAEIVDIGARTQPPPSSIGSVSVRCLGRQPAEVVSAEMLDCRFGLIHYDVTRLGKSTIFAAFAAHGVVPLVFGSNAAPDDGLQEGKHFLRGPFPDVFPRGLEAIQEGLVQWYRGHETRRLAETIASMLLSEPSLSVRNLQQRSDQPEKLAHL